MKYFKYALSLICSFVISDNLMESITNHDYKTTDLLLTIVIVIANAILIYWIAEFVYQLLKEISNEHSDTHSDGEDKDW